MIQLINLGIQFGGKILFRDVSLNLTLGRRYGIVGANGSGKTTLLKLISGELEPSEGEIRISTNLRIGLLKQNQFKYENDALMDVVLMGRGSLWKLLKEKRELEARVRLTQQEGSRLAELEHKLSAQNAYNAEGQAAILLKGLGLQQLQLTQPMSTLSGGYKLRVLIAQCLFSAPDILLLDEPNNHLDIYSIAWLGEYLKEFKGIVLVVSHDQYFLDRISTHIIDIDYETIKIYPGDYTTFLKDKQRDEEQKRLEIERLEKKRQELRAFYERFRAKATKARQAVSRKKQMDRMADIIIKRSSRQQPHFSFTIKRSSGQQVLEVAELQKYYGDLRVLAGLSFVVNRGDRIAVIGPNGVGKSTLIKILVGALEADGGSLKWGHECDIGYLPQNHREMIGSGTTVYDWLYAHTPAEKIPTLRAVLGQVLFSADDIYKSGDILSGGEAARLIFAKLLINQHNVLVLDEPTNHLDLEAIGALEKDLLRFPGTLIFVSHNRCFLNRLATGILELRFDGYSFYPGNYDDFLAREQQDYLERDIKTRIKQKTDKNSLTSEADRSKQLIRERRTLFKELSRIGQKIVQSEERIAGIEHRIREVEALFAESDIYAAERQAEFQQTYQEYQMLKNGLEAEIHQWENKHAENERLENRIAEIDAQLEC
ncbi:MAG TPA: ATP-binding cassette domain-containing protein [Candidatus Marinimicrobia bacterium]|nr:ATP-binding cassette domain-containing protein [Candidatus Neomarinimicrobiota bacterium]